MEAAQAAMDIAFGPGFTFQSFHQNNARFLSKAKATSIAEFIAKCMALSGLTESQRLCSSYVMEEMERTAQFLKLLRSPQTDGSVPKQIGALLSLTHQGLARNLKVSTPELDSLDETAMELKRSGLVHGGRLMGGGFGGCYLLLVRDAASMETVKSALVRNFKARWGQECGFIDATAGRGASVVPLGIRRRANL